MMIREIRRTVRIAVLSISLTACTAKFNVGNADSKSPDAKAAAAQKDIAEIERKRFAERACWHENRAEALESRKSRWRARLRHLEQAAGWWSEVDDARKYSCS